VADAAADSRAVTARYRLEDQVGFHLRRAGQRHAAIFASLMGEELTPTQWAALVKLAELTSVSQNLLGRETAMDAATIKGVVDRLAKRGLVSTAADPGEARRTRVSITPEGLDAVARGVEAAAAITAETLRPLDAGERRSLIENGASQLLGYDGEPFAARRSTRLKRAKCTLASTWPDSRWRAKRCRWRRAWRERQWWYPPRAPPIRRLPPLALPGASRCPAKSSCGGTRRAQTEEASGKGRPARAQGCPFAP
jgi:DNA-binding MarR family transcriptional regulator